MIISLEENVGTAKEPELRIATIQPHSNLETRHTKPTRPGRKEGRYSGIKGEDTKVKDVDRIENLESKQSAPGA